MIFILGSPRTGSTLIYQLMINLYNLFYFTNLTNNYFYKHPFVGSFLSAPFIKKVRYESNHGKTKGLFGPSEGSYIFRNWFNTKNEVSIKQKVHMIDNFRNISKFINKPIVMKNAWNCFRIKALTELFPNAKFVWIRRDIISSAYSDLQSRYVKGNPYVWNSAYTSNYRQIQKQPYWEQVVEQQYEYNRLIEIDLKKFCPYNYIEVWYDQLGSNLEQQINLISNFFRFKKHKNIIPKFEIKKYSEGADFFKILKYVENNYIRFEGYVR